MRMLFCVAPKAGPPLVSVQAIGTCCSQACYSERLYKPNQLKKTAQGAQAIPQILTGLIQHSSLKSHMKNPPNILSPFRERLDDTLNQRETRIRKPHSEINSNSRIERAVVPSQTLSETDEIHTLSYTVSLCPLDIHACEIMYSQIS